MSYIAVSTVNENPNFTINRKVNRQKGKRSLTVECILPAPQTPMLHEDSLVRIAGSLLQSAVDWAIFALRGRGPRFSKNVSLF